MSLAELLRRRRDAEVTPDAPAFTGGVTVKPLTNQRGHTCHTSYTENSGRQSQHTTGAANDPKPLAPEADIDVLLANLKCDFTGAPLYSIGYELTEAIRQAMRSMSKKACAELAALIEDRLIQPKGREKALALLGKANTQSNDSAAPMASSEQPLWTEWIAEQYPLVPEDMTHVASYLARLSMHEQEIIARRYIRTWLQAADAEPRPVRRENAGRRVANRNLLPARERQMGSGSMQHPMATTALPQLPAGVRMAWHLLIDGKGVTMAGRPCTQEQAQESAQARWPGAIVESCE
nr:hypothetical protein [uncultured Halomonas sp.]